MVRVTPMPLFSHAAPEPRPTRFGRDDGFSSDPSQTPQGALLYDGKDIRELTLWLEQNAPQGRVCVAWSDKGVTEADWSNTSSAVVASLPDGCKRALALARPPWAANGHISPQAVAVWVNP